MRDAEYPVIPVTGLLHFKLYCVSWHTSVSVTQVCHGTLFIFYLNKLIAINRNSSVPIVIKIPIIVN